VVDDGLGGGVTIRSALRPSLRILQVDSRKRMTVAEAQADSVYMLETLDDQTIVLYPEHLRRRGDRKIRVDTRHRLQFAELKPWSLYFVVQHEEGVIALVPAVAIPRKRVQEFQNQVAS
jgi:hypothetical protein